MLVVMNNSAADKSVTVNVAELGINAAELADVIAGNSYSAAAVSYTHLLFSVDEKEPKVDLYIPPKRGDLQ